MTVTDTTGTARRSIARRRVVAIGVAAASVLALSGCMKTQYDIALNPDDTASLSVVLAISDEFAESMDTDPQDMFDEYDLGSDAPEGASSEPYAEDGYTGMRYTVENAPLSAVSNEELTIERDGDEFVVSGSVDLTDEEGMDTTDTSDPMTQMFLDTFVMEYSVTFPGAVSDHNGTLDGTTVTWTPPYGEVTELSARGSAIAGGEASPTEEATAEPTDEVTAEPAEEVTAEPIDAGDDATSSGSGFPWWILIVAAVVLAAAVTGIVLLARRGGSGTAGPTTSLPPAGAAPEGQWQAAPAPGYAPPPPPPGAQPMAPPPPPVAEQPTAVLPTPVAEQPTIEVPTSGAEQPTAEVPAPPPPPPAQPPAAEPTAAEPTAPPAPAAPETPETPPPADPEEPPRP
ncbi:hypothetical protein OEB99_13725 [Actinotalea sp. M2MS4P-6]|uniref:LppM family (lipo)protein n=1 Tax=Actinotalea sp. M2MS4P-6 TaxID=2983762 RepID=UPI0021E4E12C|nr:hypothetical protein [Actinotalea sp. M2MS4P-6]MCV2395371.1 hypothetical protein [Actinotalea sp. M2MS4P-6]